MRRSPLLSRRPRISYFGLGWQHILSLLATAGAGRFSGVCAQQDVQNVTFQNTRAELVYVPAVCDVGLTDEIPTACAGLWTILDLPESSNGSVSSTDGPSEAFGDILPQVFLTFRGSALFVKTSDVSNATANLTVSSVPSGTLQSRVFEPSRDFWSFKDLDESQTTTVAVTFLPGDSQTRLDIDFIKISVSNASATSSFLPPQTIPASTFTPAFASLSTPTSTAQPRSSLAQPVGTIVGETLAGAFGLLLLAFLAFLVWRWRRRRVQDDAERQRTMRAQAAAQVMSAAATRSPLPVSMSPGPMDRESRRVRMQRSAPTLMMGRWRRDSPGPSRSFATRMSSALADDGH